MKKLPLTLFLIIVAIYFQISYVCVKYHKKWDFTSDKIFSLNTKSIALIKAQLQSPLDIYAYFDSEHELSDLIKPLLNSFNETSTLINVHWVDPYRDFNTLNSLGEIGEKFKLNQILIKMDTRHRFIQPEKLATYDRQFEHLGIKPKLLKFKGESTVLSTILEVADPAAPVVAFLKNHGERKFESEDKNSVSLFYQTLKEIGLKVVFLDINSVTQIPNNINIVVSCQPRVAFSKKEQILLEKWINQGGSLFLAIDPLINQKDKSMIKIGLEKLLKKYGITLGQDIVVDPSKMIPYSRPDNLYINTYSDFSPVSTMKNIPTLFFQARSIHVHETEKWTLAPLLATSEKGWGETNYLNADYKFDDRDNKGPIYIGSAAQHITEGPKVVVFGDSDFLSNSQINHSGNKQLIENIFLWLSKKAAVINLKNKDPKNIKLVLSRKQLIHIFLLGVCFLPLITLLGGFFFWIKRKT